MISESTLEAKINLNKAMQITVAVLVCGLTLSLMHNARLSTRISHVENALRKADESACGVKTEITDKCACAGLQRMMLQSR